MVTKLKLMLLEREITQKEFAEQIGISLPSISSLVRGKSEPSIRVALKIARVLDTTVEELWGNLIVEEK